MHSYRRILSRLTSAYIEKEKDKSSIRQHSSEIRELQSTVFRLEILAEAMWDLLEEQGCTREQLIEKMHFVNESNQLEALDPKDKPLSCAKCGRPMMGTDALLSKCIYCGATTVNEPFN